MAENKVQFNLKNVHYATILTDTEEETTYDDVVAVPGAVSLDLSQEGEITPFYADGIKYYIASSNSGYAGTLELARIPDQMLADIWGMTKNADGVITETVDVPFNDFALMFQIDGDENETLYTFYKCSAQRPTIASQTNEETKEPQTATLELSISPRIVDGKIKVHTSDTTTTAVRTAWFTTVYEETP